MNNKTIKINSAIDFLESIIEELGERRAYYENENNPVAWAMRAKLILIEVNNELSHEFTMEQLNADEPCVKCTNEKGEL